MNTQIKAESPIKKSFYCTRVQQHVEFRYHTDWRPMKVKCEQILTYQRIGPWSNYSFERILIVVVAVNGGRSSCWQEFRRRSHVFKYFITHVYHIGESKRCLLNNGIFHERLFQFLQVVDLHINFAGTVSKI